MQLKNSPEKYGAVTKTFHWLTSITIICLLGVGLYMVRAEKGPALFQIYGLHKSFGILVLTATFLRVLWHVYSKKPPLVGGMAAWERAAAHAGHFFLYVCMIGMPLSGWVMSSAFNRPGSFFNLFELPNIISWGSAQLNKLFSSIPVITPPDAELGETLSEIHEYLAYALIGMILLHAAAALKHHFMSKDATLKRMLPFGKP